LVLGPLAGGALFARYGFRAPFFAAAALQLVTLVVTLAVLPESRRTGGEAAAGPRAIVSALRDPRVAPVLWQKLAFSLGLYGWFAVLALVLQAQLGFDAARTSYVFAGFGAIMTALQLGAVGRLSEALGDQLASNLGFASTALSLAIVPFLHGYGVLAAMMVLFSLGQALCVATIPALISAAAPRNARGTLLGVGSSLDSLAGIVMPPVSTGVLGAHGVVPTAGICALLAAVALALGIVRSRSPR
jgi:DHA1 family tetracycline resistance protein-like MFS transporter